MSNKIPETYIDELIEQSEEKVWEPFPGITIVAWRLPNGYTISDQSGCVDPLDYDRELGIKFAREHLKTKLWELEGYLRKQSFSYGGTD